MRQFLLVSLLLVNIIAFSQVSKADYEKSVDILACKAVEVVITEPTRLKEFQANCNCSGPVSIDKIRNLVPSTEKATIQLIDEITGLKSKYDTTRSAKNVIDYLTKDVFSDNSYTALSRFSNKRKKDGVFEKFQMDVATLLSKNIKDKPTVVAELPKESEPETESNSSSQSQESSDNKGGPIDDQTFQVATIICIVVLMLMLLLLFRKIANISESSQKNRALLKRLESHVDSIGTVKTQVQPKSNNNSNEIELIKQRNELEEIKRRLETLSASDSNLTRFSTNTIIETDENEKTASEFYLSTPNPDGSFNESSAQVMFREGASIYRFKKISGTKATFQIEDKDASIRLALQYPDKNIDPVCDAVNAFNPKTRRIITRKPGEVELINGRWKVLNKASISYEN